MFFSQKVKDYNLGCVYKVGDVTSLCLALQHLRNDLEYYKKFEEALGLYQKERNIENYSKK